MARSDPPPGLPATGSTAEPTASPPSAAAPAAVAAPRDALPPGCVGSSFDLDDPRVLELCGVDGARARPIAAGSVTLSIEPPTLWVRHGTDGMALLGIRNTTAAPLELDLDVSCGTDFTFSSEIWDQGFKRRLDLTRSSACGGATACPVQHLVRLRLAENGLAWLRVPVRTRVVDDCTGRRLSALPAGAYGLRIKTPLGLTHQTRLTLK